MKRSDVIGRKVKILIPFLLVLLVACTQRSVQKSETAGRAKTVTLKIPNYPLSNEQELDVLMEQIGYAKVELLGEASHGTARC